jgi:hypothetical protein
METYRKQAPKTGKQFLAEGTGEQLEEGSRWRRDSVNLSIDGSPSKVVMDDRLNRGDKSPIANSEFWDTKLSTEEADKPERRVLLPVHTYVLVFSLRDHEYLTTHITNLTPYKYDASLRNKLVLPQGNKILIDALTGDSVTNRSDIIQGKARGVIILCSGLPGTGKTLTGEVYAELIQCPLYIVQCSQLGTDEGELEKELAKVLNRATRWGAILLIDEADVYIHERGDDIQQNAIVGVFLRLLEYYNGILFMTTNRATIIDDAILSRVTAHVRYDTPKDDDRDRLWKIILTQYGRIATAGFVKKCVEKFPNVSGRSIRQLVRLGIILQKASGEKTASLFRFIVKASRFHDYEGKPNGSSG